jgi:glycerol transport system ATP-binding protein
VSLSRGGEAWIRPTSMRLERGRLHVLLGPVRAGKTSLIRLMSGLDAPTGGRIRMDGADVTGVSVRRRNVAVVYQQFVNYPSLSVFENIASPLRVQKATKGDIETAVKGAAERLGLSAMLGRKPSELSGGQQQRVAIARALVKRADLVLLDEPLANLDYKLREELRADLPGLFAEMGAVVVYAASEPGEALALGGETLVVHEGRVTQSGPAVEVWRDPADLATARVLCDPPLNVLEARGRWGAEAAGASHVAIRPHHLSARGGEVALEAEVIDTEVTGSESFVHLGAEGVRLTMAIRGVHAFPVGARLTVGAQARHVMLFDAAGRRLPNRAAG